MCQDSEVKKVGWAFFPTNVPTLRLMKTHLINFDVFLSKMGCKYVLREIIRSVENTLYWCHGQLSDRHLMPKKDSFYMIAAVLRGFMGACSPTKDIKRIKWMHSLFESAGFLSKYVVQNSFSSSWRVLAIQLKYARQIESFPQVFLGWKHEKVGSIT